MRKLANLLARYKIDKILFFLLIIALSVHVVMLVMGCDDGMVDKYSTYIEMPTTFVTVVMITFIVFFEKNKSTKNTKL